MYNKQAEKYIINFIEKQSNKYNISKYDIYLVMSVKDNNKIIFNLLLNDEYEYINNKIKKYTLQDIIGNLTYNLLNSIGTNVDKIILEKIDIDKKNNNKKNYLYNIYIYEKNNKVVIDIYENNKYIKKVFLN